MKLFEITGLLEAFAPLSYQESYDNSGLIYGDYNSTVDGILISLDVTEDIIEEAIQRGLNLIIAHHPLIYNGIKKLSGSNFVERALIKAIQNNIAIYCAHTNIDSIIGGVNSKIAEKIGLQNLKILNPIQGELHKLVVFVPKKELNKVRTAIFKAGAGHIGNYDQCSFNIEGYGTFRGLENTNPFVGEKGKFHTEDEVRLETIFPKTILKNVVQAMIQSHPYEEVAYDIYPLNNLYDKVGIGLIGNLPTPEDELEFLKRVKTNFGCGVIRHTKLLNKKIEKVALCGGSGSFLIPKAISKRANILITGDIKYHQFFEANNKILIADIGHYESEQYTKEIFYDLLIKKLPKFAVHLSEINTNPINYL